MQYLQEHFCWRLHPFGGHSRTITQMERPQEKSGKYLEAFNMGNPVEEQLNIS